MTKTEYIGRVISFYARKRINLGYLNFDKNVGRFIICDGENKNIFTYRDGLHCGDSYILKVSDDTWKIGQCELDDDNVWKMFGTNITSENCENVHVLYVKNERLTRIMDEYVDQNVDFGSFSDDFVRCVLGCFEV